MATDSMVTESIPYRSASDEFVNAVTHGIGIVLSVVAAAVLYQTTRSAGIWMQVAVMAYAASLFAVYLLSTLSHAVQTETNKNRLRAWDQGTIYFLIVGTYTPFVAAYLPPMQAALLATVLWLVAGVGFWLKVVAKHRINAFSSWSYLALGWVPAMALISQVPFDCVMWMALGGISYTVGVAFLLLDTRVSFFHAVWHLLVILASACHFYAILTYVAA